MDGVHYIMKYDDKIGTYLQGVQIVDESVNEDSPCWKGYKQVGMKDKGGRQVQNCVPNESVVKESMISEEFSTWEMSFDNMNLGGVQLNRKNKYKVTARNTVEAIKKAAKMAGVKDGQWVNTKTYSLNKL